MASEVEASEPSLPVLEDRAGTQEASRPSSEGTHEIKKLSINGANGEPMDFEHTGTTTASPRRKTSTDQDIDKAEETAALPGEQVTETALNDRPADNEERMEAK